MGNRAADAPPSTRRVDADGRLHIASNHITKANVCEYLGAEIPNYAALGLRSDALYKLYRHPEELQKAVPTANNIQLLKRHIGVSADDPKQMDVVGSTGTDAVWADPYIDNSLAIWEAVAIAGVETEEVCELSSSYRYRADMTPGTATNGERYDGVMRDIIFNHVAIVEKGRAGPDVAVGDALSQEPVVMTIKLKTALMGAAANFKAQADALAPKLAADAALKPLHKTYLKLAADAEKKAKDVKEDEDCAEDEPIPMKGEEQIEDVSVKAE